MKAIPRQPKPAILAFNFEGERYDTLKALCDELEVGLINHRASENPAAFSLTLGDLLEGGSVATQTELTPEAKLAMSALAFPEEMFLLANLSEETLNAFPATRTCGSRSRPSPRRPTPAGDRWPSRWNSWKSTPPCRPLLRNTRQNRRQKRP